MNTHNCISNKFSLNGLIISQTCISQSTEFKFSIGMNKDILSSYSRLLQIVNLTHECHKSSHCIAYDLLPGTLLYVVPSRRWQSLMNICRAHNELKHLKNIFKRLCEHSECVPYKMGIPGSCLESVWHRAYTWNVHRGGKKLSFPCQHKCDKQVSS